MGKWARVALAACAASLALAGAALGITNGQVDGNAHPNVGALYATANGEATGTLFCSGSLVAPGIFVTAAHCVVAIAQAPDPRYFVTFAPAPGPSPAVATLIPGVPTVDPQYRGKDKDPHDIAVIKFNPNAAPGVRPVQIAPRGFLDALLKGRANDKGDPGDEVGRYQDTWSRARSHYRDDRTNDDDDTPIPGLTFVDVGYGLVDIEADRDGIRRFAVSGKPKLRDDVWLVLSQKTNQGFGGTCTGDSGGPQFFGSLQVSITITGDENCVRRGVNLRLDVSPTRAFLASQGVPGS
jgi:hypothetical protein